MFGFINPEYKNSSKFKPLYGGSDDDSKFVYSKLIKNTTSKIIGPFVQKYPSFSSKTVGGKQLFQLSKDDELPENLPEHEVTIHKLLCTSTMMLGVEDLGKEIINRVSLVKGDFRQKNIINKWDDTLENTKQKEFETISLVCECSSGTYIRQLVADIGESIGVPIVTYSIKRTKIGEYSIDDKSRKGV